MERKIIEAAILPPIKPGELNQLASVLPDKGTMRFRVIRPRGRRFRRNHNKQCRHLECSIKKRRCAGGLSGLT